MPWSHCGDTGDETILRSIFEFLRLRSLRSRWSRWHSFEAWEPTTTVQWHSSGLGDQASSWNSNNNPSSSCSYSENNFPTPFEASVTEKLAMKPMYSQGKLVRFTKACPECTATSLCHSCRLKKTHEPCNQSPLVEDCDATFKIFKTGQTQIHGANICKYGFKKKLGVLCE